MTDPNKCPDCKGRGYHEMFMHRANCTVCKGKGVLPAEPTSWYAQLHPARSAEEIHAQLRAGALTSKEAQQRLQELLAAPPSTSSNPCRNVKLPPRTGTYDPAKVNISTVDGEPLDVSKSMQSLADMFDEIHAEINAARVLQITRLRWKE